MVVDDKVNFWRGNKNVNILCISGKSGSGKSTLARRYFTLFKENTPNQDCVVLDGDVCRRFVSADLTYTDEDRKTNNERIAKIALMLAFMGKSVIIATVRADLAYNYIKEACEKDEYMASRVSSILFKLTF